MQFAIVSIALITWMFLVFPGADADDMEGDTDAEGDADPDPEGAESVADCLKKHGGRCVKKCDSDETQVQNCTGGFCCREKCD